MENNNSLITKITYQLTGWHYFHYEFSVKLYYGFNHFSVFLAQKFNHVFIFSLNDDFRPLVYLID